LGFAVIGAGRIGALHARHLAGAVEGARLVRVVDPDVRRGGARGARRRGAGDAFDDALSPTRPSTRC
jgi:predicted dehydrogenase